MVNAQRTLPINSTAISQLARCAVRRLRIHAKGTLVITFISGRRIRALNQRFLRHDRLTDVLTFRYDGEPVVGEVLIAPAAARAYAKRHGVPYEAELSRYVIHGLLHWLGHRDSTPQQRRSMRQREDKLLAACGVLTSRDRGHGTGDKGTRRQALSPVSCLLSQECD